MNPGAHYGQHLYDELLAIRSRRGDERAFEELTRRWEKPLFYFIRRIIGGEADAWDVLQEVWLKAFRSIGSLREPTRFRTWLYSIARHSAMSHHRAEYRERNHLAELPLDSSDFTPPLPDPSEAERVHEALDRIPLPFREALTLYFLEDLSVSEIAEVLGIPSGTVKSRLFHARTALKKELEREAHDEK
jgi:RNA polymerase sigma-70 factor (ECF subfamily)